MIRVVVAPTYERARVALHERFPETNPYAVRIVTGPSSAAACRGNSYVPEEILWVDGWEMMRGASEVRDFLRILTKDS